MMTSSGPLGRSVRLALATGGLLAILSAPASADPIKYMYSGTITTAEPSSGVAVGAPFSGTFTYDPTPSQGGSTPTPVPEGMSYLLDRSVAGADMTASVGGKSVIGTAGGLHIVVASSDADITPGDPRGFVSIANLGGSSDGSKFDVVNLISVDHPLLMGDGLPKAFDLGDFTTAQFAAIGPNDDPRYYGTITSLAAEPTPEPSTLAVLATAGGFALAKSRSRRKRVTVP